MKKLFFALLFFSTTSILADQPCMLNSHQSQGTSSIAGDYLVYSQPYGPGTYGVMIGEDGWVCDDFVLEDNYYIDEIYVWTMWPYEQTATMNLVISEDDIGDSNPNTNIDVWSETVPCTNTFTGDSNWGFDIYETHCIISADAYPELDPGVHYYFEVQAGLGINCAMLFIDNLVGDYCWFDFEAGTYTRSDTLYGAGMDMFFDFWGEPVNALEPETWGSIKTLF